LLTDWRSISLPWPCEGLLSSCDTPLWISHSKSLGFKMRRSLAAWARVLEVADASFRFLLFPNSSSADLPPSTSGPPSPESLSARAQASRAPGRPALIPGRGPYIDTFLNDAHVLSEFTVGHMNVMRRTSLPDRSTVTGPSPILRSTCSRLMASRDRSALCCTN
jgi:hypothetical protein